MLWSLVITLLCVSFGSAAVMGPPQSIAQVKPPPLPSIANAVLDQWRSSSLDLAPMIADGDWNNTLPSDASLSAGVRRNCDSFHYHSKPQPTKLLVSLITNLGVSGPQSFGSRFLPEAQYDIDYR